MFYTVMPCFVNSMAAAPFPSALALHLHIHYLTLSMTSSRGAQVRAGQARQAKTIIKEEDFQAQRYVRISRPTFKSHCMFTHRDCAIIIPVISSACRESYWRWNNKCVVQTVPSLSSPIFCRLQIFHLTLHVRHVSARARAISLYRRRDTRIDQHVPYVLYQRNRIYVKARRPHSRTLDTHNAKV